MNARLNGLCLNYAGYLCRGWVVTLWISWPTKGWRLASIGMDMAARHSLVDDRMVLHGSTSENPVFLNFPGLPKKSLENTLNVGMSVTRQIM